MDSTESPIASDQIPTSGPIPQRHSRPLEYRDFRLLLLMQLASSMRQPTLFITQAWYVNTVAPESERIMLLGLLAALRGLAFLGFVLFGGTFADRFPRVTMLATSHLIGLASVLFIGGLLLIPEVANGDGPWLAIMLMLFASFGLINAQDLPTRTAMVRDAVPSNLLSKAITQHQMVMALGVLAAFGAGAAIESLGFGTTYLLAGIGHIIVLATLRGISTRTASDPDATQVSIISNLREGIKVLNENRIVAWTIFSTWTITALGLSVMGILVAAWITDILQLDAFGWGAMVVTWGAGGLLASVWMNWRSDINHIGAWFLGAGLLTGLSIIAFGFSRTIIAAFFFNGMVGMAFQLIQTWGITIVQREVPNRLLGRVTSLLLLAGGLMQIAGLGAGILARIWGLEIIYPLSGAAIVLYILIVTWLQRPLRLLN